MSIDVESARAFLEVATTRSLAGAPEKLQVTQTAVSARIRVFEQQHGRTLFSRELERTTPAVARFDQIQTNA